jgi:MFS family permease
MPRTVNLLPRAFTRLWASDALSSAGDGFTLVAAPLLVLGLTENPILVAGAATAGYLPWVLFGLLSGTVVDRVDQRRLIVVVDTVRAALMAVLAISVWTDTVTVWLIYALLFLSGSGDTLTATAAASLTPRVVDRADLTRANARLLGTRLVGGALLARPIGAWLFGHGAGTPFAVDAVSFLIGSALLIGLPVRPRTPAPATAQDEPPRSRVREGLRLLWADDVLRILAVCILLMNITLAATTAILVLVARDRLGLGASGYGLLLATLAVGGLIGTALVNRLLSRFGPALLLTVGLLIEAGTQLTLALATSFWVAGAALLVFGVHSAVWSVLTASLRQHRISDDARGRVISAYTVLSVGGAALGSALGGVLVDTIGLTAPMWFGAAVVAAVFVVASPRLRASAMELGERTPVAR